MFHNRKVEDDDGDDDRHDDDSKHTARAQDWALF